MKRGYTWAFTALIVAALALQSTFIPGADQDGKGDSTVDIRDLQAALSGALMANSTDMADVNDDGDVNILDLQRMLAEAAGANEADPVPDCSSSDAVLPATLRMNQPVFAPATLSTIDSLLNDAPHRVASNYGTSNDPPLREWLLRSLVAPNGPPLAS